MENRARTKYGSLQTRGKQALLLTQILVLIRKQKLNEACVKLPACIFVYSLRRGRFNGNGDGVGDKVMASWMMGPNQYFTNLMMTLLAAGMHWPRLARLAHA